MSYAPDFSHELSIKSDLSQHHFDSYLLDVEKAAVGVRCSHRSFATKDLLECSSLLHLGKTREEVRQWGTTVRQNLEQNPSQWKTLSSELRRLSDPSFLTEVFQDPVRMEKDYYRLADEKHCREVLAGNQSKENITDCYSCLTRGQHRRFLPYFYSVFLYDTLFPDQKTYQAMFPDTGLVTEMMKKERDLYLQLLKKTVARFATKKETYEDFKAKETDFQRYSLYLGKTYLECDHVLPFVKRHRLYRQKRYLLPFLQRSRLTESYQKADDIPSLEEEYNLWDLTPSVLDTQYCSSNREHTTVEAVPLLVTLPPEAVKEMKPLLPQRSGVHLCALDGLDSLYEGVSSEEGDDNDDDGEKESGSTHPADPFLEGSGYPQDDSFKLQLNGKLALESLQLKSYVYKKQITFRNGEAVRTFLSDVANDSAIDRIALSIEVESLLFLLKAPWDRSAFRLPVEVDVEHGTRKEGKDAAGMALAVHIQHALPPSVETREALFSKAIQTTVEQEPGCLVQPASETTSSSQDSLDEGREFPVYSFMELRRPVLARDNATRTGSNSDNKVQRLPFIVHGKAFGVHPIGTPSTTAAPPFPIFNLVKIHYLNNGHDQGGPVQPKEGATAASYLQEQLQLPEVLHLSLLLQCFPNATVYLHHVHPYRAPLVFQVDCIQQRDLDSFLFTHTTAAIRELVKVAWDVALEALQSCVKGIGLAVARHVGLYKGEEKVETLNRFNFILSKFSDKGVDGEDGKLAAASKKRKRSTIDKRVVALLLSPVRRWYPQCTPSFDLKEESELGKFIQRIDEVKRPFKQKEKEEEEEEEELFNVEGIEMSDKEDEEVEEEKGPSYTEQHFIRPANWTVSDRIPFSFQFRPLGEE